MMLMNKDSYDKPRPQAASLYQRKRLNSVYSLQTQRLEQSLGRGSDQCRASWDQIMKCFPLGNRKNWKVI